MEGRKSGERRTSNAEPPNRERRTSNAEPERQRPREAAALAAEKKPRATPPKRRNTKPPSKTAEADLARVEAAERKARDTWESAHDDLLAARQALTDAATQPIPLALSSADLPVLPDPPRLTFGLPARPAHPTPLTYRPSCPSCYCDLMYTTVLALHSWIRWIALVAVVGTTLAALRGKVAGANSLADRWGMVAMMALDIAAAARPPAVLRAQPEHAAILRQLRRAR